MRKPSGLMLAAAGGLGVVVVIASALMVIARDDDGPWERAAVRGAAAWVESTLAARQRALGEAAARLAGLEARPPEVVTRALAALASDPAFLRLYAIDRAGRVVVTWPEKGGPAPGSPDPSAARRGAVKAASPRALALAGVAGVAERVEMLVAVVPAGAGGPELWLAADVDARVVAEGLERLEDGAGGGVAFAVVGAGGLVVHPRQGMAIAPAPGEAAADVGLGGLDLRVARMPR